MDQRGLSRRGFLKGLAVAAGATVGTRIAGGTSLIGNALAATEPTSLVVIHLVGGYNALWTSADTLVGSFGVTAGNHTKIGGGVGIDNVLANALPAFAKQHMAVLGVRHGLSSHPAARQALWSAGSNNAGLVLASAMGGSAALKAAVVGGNLIAEAPRTAVNGVSFQSVMDMQATIDALGGGTPDARSPDRTVALAGMTGAQKMSDDALGRSPGSLVSLKNGLAAAVDQLKQPVQTFDVNGLKTAYGLTGTAVRSFASKMAAAELMIRAGTNVVAAFDPGWDSHGDVNGNNVRNQMSTEITPALGTFVTRMVQDPTRNVVVCILGDFARSLPGSDHQPNLSVTVMGKYVKQGTTGKVDSRVSLAPSTPGIAAMWAHLAAATKTAGSPFGANAHGLIV